MTDDDVPTDLTAFETDGDSQEILSGRVSKQDSYGANGVKFKACFFAIQVSSNCIARNDV